MLSPAGGAAADVMSREAEGQQGTEPAAEKFSCVRQNSLDIFSPACDGQMMPSTALTRHTLSLYFILTVFGLSFTDSRTQGAAGDGFGRAQGKKKRSQVCSEKAFSSGSDVVLCSSQFGDDVQRVRGSAGHRSDQFGRFLPSQRRSGFAPLLVDTILM